MYHNLSERCLCVREGFHWDIRSLVELQKRQEDASKQFKKVFYSFAEVFPCYQITSICLISEMNVLM